MKRQLFLGVGVQKCATTWLYDILVDHPHLALSKRKEVDFFSYHYGRGYQWYQDQFPADSANRINGELSPSYFIDPAVPERVKTYAPDVKILVSLRDPLERAISNHRHEVRLGHFHGDDLSFESGLANNPLYLEQSRYGTHLQRWLKVIPESRMLILFQEDIDSDPLAVAEDVYRFLDIDPDHVSRAIEQRSNESHVYKFRVIEHTRKAARQVVRFLGVDGLWRAGQKVGLQRLYRLVNRRPPDARIPPVSAATRERLRFLLEDEIRLVEQITRRPLPQWRSGSATARTAITTDGELHTSFN